MEGGFSARAPVLFPLESWIPGNSFFPEAAMNSSALIQTFSAALCKQMGNLSHIL